MATMADQQQQPLPPPQPMPTPAPMPMPPPPMPQEPQAPQGPPLQQHWAFGGPSGVGSSSGGGLLSRRSSQTASSSRPLLSSPSPSLRSRPRGAMPGRQVPVPSPQDHDDVGASAIGGEGNPVPSADSAAAAYAFRASASEPAFASAPGVSAAVAAAATAGPLSSTLGEGFLPPLSLSLNGLGTPVFSIEADVNQDLFSPSVSAGAVGPSSIDPADGAAPAAGRGGPAPPGTEGADASLSRQKKAGGKKGKKGVKKSASSSALASQPTTPAGTPAAAALAAAAPKPRPPVHSSSKPTAQGRTDAVPAAASAAAAGGSGVAGTARAADAQEGRKPIIARTSSPVGLLPHCSSPASSRKSLKVQEQQQQQQQQGIPVRCDSAASLESTSPTQSSPPIRVLVPGLVSDNDEESSADEGKRRGRVSKGRSSRSSSTGNVAAVVASLNALNANASPASRGSMSHSNLADAAAAEAAEPEAAAGTNAAGGPLRVRKRAGGGRKKRRGTGKGEDDRTSPGLSSSNSSGGLNIDGAPGHSSSQSLSAGSSEAEVQQGSVEDGAAAGAADGSATDAVLAAAPAAKVSSADDVTALAGAKTPKLTAALAAQQLRWRRRREEQLQLQAQNSPKLEALLVKQWDKSARRHYSKAADGEEGLLEKSSAPAIGRDTSASPERKQQPLLPHQQQNGTGNAGSSNGGGDVTEAAAAAVQQPTPKAEEGEAVGESGGFPWEVLRARESVHADESTEFETEQEQEEGTPRARVFVANDSGSSGSLDSLPRDLHDVVPGFPVVLSNPDFASATDSSEMQNGGLAGAAGGVAIGAGAEASAAAAEAAADQDGLSRASGGSGARVEGGRGSVTKTQASRGSIVAQRIAVFSGGSACSHGDVSSRGSGGSGGEAGSRSSNGSGRSQGMDAAAAWKAAAPAAASAKPGSSTASPAVSGSISDRASAAEEKMKAKGVVEVEGLAGKDCDGGDGGDGKVATAAAAVVRGVSDNICVLRCPSTAAAPDAAAKADGSSAAESSECVVFLLGTAHVSKESCEEVRRVIRLVKPEVVFLEVCPDRVAVLMPSEELEVPSFADMLRAVRSGNTNAFAAAYSWMLAKVANKMDVFPGAEFRAAYEEAMACGAIVKLGDRPVQVTLRRTWALMSTWHKVKLVAMLLLQAMWLPSKSELEDVMEQLKQSDMLTMAVRELGQTFPSLVQTLITERDLFMTAMLRHVARKSSAVVAVVGKGHLRGIEENWERTADIDVQSLLKMPPKPSSYFSPTFRRWAPLCAAVSVTVLVVTVRVCSWSWSTAITEREDSSTKMHA